jgi:DNA-binding MurR/RpiR family transcriptional regulator
MGEDLAGLGPDDVVVLFGFRRRTAGFGQLVAAIERRGVSLVLIADTLARRHADGAAVWLECPIDSASAFDSDATAMSLANLLATGAMGAHVRETRTRIADITQVYEDLDELEAPW